MMLQSINKSLCIVEHTVVPNTLPAADGIFNHSHMLLRSSLWHIQA